MIVTPMKRGIEAHAQTTLSYPLISPFQTAPHIHAICEWAYLRLFMPADPYQHQRTGQSALCLYHC